MPTRDLSAAIAAVEDALHRGEGRDLPKGLAEVAVNVAAPILEGILRAELPAPVEVIRELFATLRAFRETIAGPPAPDEEVRSWPLATPEQEFGGGVWCGDDNCPLQAEGSEIGDFRERTFTLAELHVAVGHHISARRDREEEVTE